MMETTMPKSVAVLLVFFLAIIFAKVLKFNFVSTEIQPKLIYIN